MYPFTISEPFVPVETHKHIDAGWRRPLEVWKSFRGSRAPYGAAAQRAYMPSHVSIGCVLLKATGLQGVREFAQLCKAAKELLGDGVIQVVCLLPEPVKDLMVHCRGSSGPVSMLRF